jgi:hypothetical protein
MPAINLYYSNFFGGLMGQLRKVSLGGALGAASTASAPSTAATTVRAHLDFDAAFCEAGLLPLWDTCRAF